MSTNKPSAPKLKEIAARISAHLKRLEADPGSNPKNRMGASRFYVACAWVAGRFVGIRYVSYQTGTYLPKQKALDYLAYLDAGGKETHYGLSR